MTTFLVCPVCGALPADNGTDTSKANNVVPTASDAVAVGSGVIGSTTSTALTVGGTAIQNGTFLQIPTRKETMLVTAGGGTTGLTVARGQKGTQPSGAIASTDVILTGLDANGNPPHCPLCGTAALTLDPAAVTTLTTVAAGSQHPADADAVYVTSSHEPESQNATAYGHTINGLPVYPHGFATPNRGSVAITPETINTVVGP